MLVYQRVNPCPILNSQNPPKKIDVCVLKFCTEIPGWIAENSLLWDRKLVPVDPFFWQVISGQSSITWWNLAEVDVFMHPEVRHCWRTPPLAITGVQGNLWQSWKLVLCISLFAGWIFPVFVGACSILWIYQFLSMWFNWVYKAILEGG